MKHRAKYGEPLKWIKERIAFSGDECLIWPFARSRKGYGKVRFNGSIINAHRVMCILAHGDAPYKHEAAHTCGKGHIGCVNPKHLLWKTSTDNHADMVLHGTRLLGEKHKRSKLTESEVREIRSLAATGIKSEALASKYSVSSRAVRFVVNRISWAWLS